MIATDFLICPICGSALHIDGKSYRCSPSVGSKIHCFDISSSGYADLSYRSGGSGDSKEAVNDRTAFLNKDYYLPLAEEIERLCAKHLPKEFLMVDAGCGEGYYSDYVASRFETAFLFGADLSKHAVHRASVRRNMRGGHNCFYAVASVFALPIRSSAANGMLSMFAPVAEDECVRVLKDGGVLIIGAAGDRHLYDLKEAIYDEVHINEERADLPTSMTLIEKTNVTYRIAIDNNNDIQRLFGMTPYKYRTSAKSVELLNSLDRLDTEVNVDFYVYKK